MHRKKSASLLRRLQALCLAAVTLWAAAVTAGSDSAAAAVLALRSASPLCALQWELGDLRGPRDGLSPAAVLTLREAPLLLSARPAVAELRAAEQTAPSPIPEAPPEQPLSTPAEETPLDVIPAADNGVPAKTLVPTDPGGYTVCGRTYISNSTRHTLSAAALQEDFAAELSAGEGPQILILHTHGSEAYTPAEDAGIVWSGDHRTTDSRYNVVRVGDEMADVFAQAGIAVLHDRTLYDYPSYSDAYDRALTAIQSYLAQYPSIRFVLDVHRDAIADTEGNQYKVLSDTERGSAAQLTLVVGSDGSGLPHPNWMENLKLSAALQEACLRVCPTLMRPILLRDSRYNQHATAGSLLVEVGAAGNSPEEALLAGRLFAEQMSAVLLDKRR